MPVVVLNSALTGLAVLLLAQLQLIACAAGKTLLNSQMASGPFVFDYAHQDHLRFWHWSLGALVAVLAIFELWQDWHKPPRSRD